MRRLLLFPILALPVFGQLPADSLLSKLREPVSPRARLLQERPGAVELQRAVGRIVYRLSNGQYQGLFGNGLTWVDDQGAVQLNEPVLWTTDQGWLVTGGPATVRISHNLVGGTDDVALWRKTAQWESFALRIPAVTYQSDFTFSFSDQGLTWYVDAGGEGFDVRSQEIASSLGSASYTWNSRTINLTLTTDVEGHLVGTGASTFRLSRAAMVGRDRRRYPCSAWAILPLDRIRFTCDDRTLPPAAFPYVIDPNASYPTAASEDDGVAQSLSSESWPPTSGGSSEVVGWWVAALYKYQFGWYSTSIPLFRFNTSGLPDNATVTAASLVAFYRGDDYDFEDGPFNFTLKGEYYSGWPIDAADWVPPASLGISAFSVPYSTLQTYGGATWSNLALSNLGNVSLTGYTGLRLGITMTDNAAPTGANGVNFWTHGNTNGAYKPYLSVTYSVPTPPRVIVVHSGPGG